jgi:hypothetical protein|tara:strand:- start:1151 stop:1486 length:336 start_codon:yes stop_codon:yes gene_type:complete
MDGSIDIRLIVTLAGMLFSVAGAAAVAKMQLKIINEQLKDIESRLRVMDKRVDHTELTGQRVDVLSKMLSPDARETLHRSLASMETRLENCEVELNRLRNMHNGKHPEVHK